MWWFSPTAALHQSLFQSILLSNQDEHKPSRWPHAHKTCEIRQPISTRNSNRNHGQNALLSLLSFTRTTKLIVHYGICHVCEKILGCRIPGICHLLVRTTLAPMLCISLSLVCFVNFACKNERPSLSSVLLTSINNGDFIVVTFGRYWPNFSIWQKLAFDFSSKLSRRPRQILTFFK